MGNKKYLWVYAVASLLGVIFLFFSSSNVGGDDSRLYFLFPKQWGSGVTDNFISSYLGNFNPQYFYLSLALVGSVFNNIPFGNPQTIYSFSIFSLGLVFMYLTVIQVFLLFSVPSYYKYIIAFLATCIYLLSPLLFFSNWYNPLSSLTNFVSFPLITFFILKGIYKQKYFYAILGNLVLLPFSTGLASIPITLGYILIFIIFLATVLIIQANKTILSFLLQYIFLFALVFLVFNLYWVLPMFSALSSTNEAASFALSEGGRSVAYETVKIVARESSVINALQNLPSLSLYRDNPYIGFNIKFSFLSLIYPFTIIFITIVLFIKKDKNLRVWLLMSIPFIFALYLHVVNFGPPGISLFIFFTEHIPGWVMFKNFFNKFVIPFVLLYSIFLSLGLSFISKHIGKKAFILLLSMLFFVTFLQSLPFISGKINQVVVVKNSSGDTVRTTNVTIPSYFFELVSDLNKSAKDQRILSFPLSYASWSMLEDEVDKDIYVGLSPISSFTGIDDFNGAFAFNTADSYIPGIKNTFIDSLYYKDANTFKNTLGILGVKYIVVNKKIYQEDYKDVYEKFAWGGYDFQSLENVNALLQDKSFKLVKTYGPNKTLQLYEFTDGVGKFATINSLVSYQNISLSDLLKTEYYNKSTGFVSKQFVDKGISHLVTYSLEGTEKLYFTGDLPSWNKGWAWPEANYDPGSYKYFLISLKEKVTLMRTSKIEDKLNLEIWLMAKRAEEYNKYNNVVSKDGFNKKLNNNIKSIQLLDNKDPFKEGVVKKLYAYVERSISLNPDLLDSETLVAYNFFKNNNLKKCLYDVCYILPNLSNDYFLELLNEDEPEVAKYYLDGVEVSQINTLRLGSSEGLLGVTYETTELPKEDFEVPLISSSNKTNLISLAEFLEKNSVIRGYQYRSIKENSNYLITGVLNYRNSNFGLAVFGSKDLGSGSSSQVEYSLIYNIYEGDVDLINLGQVIQSSKKSRDLVFLIYSRDWDVHGDMLIDDLKVKLIPDQQIYFSSRNLESVVLKPCNVKYSKISTEMYSINKSCSSTLLVMSDSYHKGWFLDKLKPQNKLTSVKNYLQKKSGVGEHFVINGYANAWYINDNAKSDLEVFFKPRNLLYIGSFISILSISVSIVYLLYLVITSDKVKSKINEIHNRNTRR